MQQSTQRTVKGIGIALVVLSALSLIGYISTFFAVSSADLVNVLTIQMINNIGQASLTYDEVEALRTGMNVLFSLLAGLAIWCMICTAASLVSGIFATKDSKNGQKYGRIFGWSIASTVAAALSCNLIKLVLSGVLIYFSSKGRKEEAASQYFYPQESAQPEIVNNPSQNAPY